MSAGLKDVMKPIEVSKEDWVMYKGIYYPPNTARAKKAWDTMRAKQKKKSYNRTNKNSVREDIARIIKNNLPKESTILTMETKEFLFVKQLLDYYFYICEKSRKSYMQMCDEYNKNKEIRKSIDFLHHGNIIDILVFPQSVRGYYDVVYLDFCCTFGNAKKTIESLYVHLFCSRYFGFTFCLRKNQKEKLDDYKFDMIYKLQNFLTLEYNKHSKDDDKCKQVKLTYDLVYGKAYRDKNHAPMITLFFKNTSRNPNVLNEEMENMKKTL